MVLDLVIIGLVIALLPLTIVAFTRILGAQQGIWKGLAFMAGWLACLVAVIAVVVLVTGDKQPAPHTATSTAALVVKALLGGLLIWVGLRQRRWMGRPRKQPGWMARLDHLSLWAAAGSCLFAAMVAGGGWGRRSCKPSCPPRATGWRWSCSACWPRRASWSWSSTRSSPSRRPCAWLRLPRLPAWPRSARKTSPERAGACDLGALGGTQTSSLTDP